MSAGVVPSWDGTSIFKELSFILEENVLINEYDFIFIETDVSPFVVIEDKLGIELKTAKYLSLWLNKEFFKSKQTDLDKNYLEKITRCLLLFISDCATAWNIRKEFILERRLEKSAELRFISLVLSKHPKSSEVFFHRKWLLQQLIDESSECPIPLPTSILASSCERCNLLEKELEVCRKCSSKRANNQSAWSHRFWVLNNLACHPLEMTNKELESSKSFLSVNLSDNSAFNYRKNLLINLLQLDANNCRTFVTMVTEEFKFIWDLLNFYDKFESLWYHRRFVLCLVMDICKGKDCLSEIQKSFANLARDVGPSPTKSKSGHFRHNHLSHSHYHHSIHRHYNHHHHNHSDQHKVNISNSDITSNGFEFLQKYPEEIDPETAKELLDAVNEEIKFFVDLKVKFQRSYVPKVECSWPDVIARQYVAWFKFKLKEFIEN